MNTKKKSTTKRKAHTNITRQDLLRLYNIAEDESQTEEARDWLWGYFSDLASLASCLDYTGDKRIFTRAVGEVIGNIEANSAPYEPTNDDYQTLKMVLGRVSSGETLTAIYDEIEAQRNRRRVAELNKPEPKDKQSAEWRYWKLRQLERAFHGTDAEAYRQAWGEYRALVRRLTTDENFYHTSHALALLPQLIIINQQIEAETLRDRRMKAGQKGAAKRRKK